MDLDAYTAHIATLADLNASTFSDAQLIAFAAQHGITTATRGEVCSALVSAGWTRQSIAAAKS